MTKVKAWEITDEFWSRVQLLIPVRQRIAELVTIGQQCISIKRSRWT
jgi:hypothetical protein